MAGSTFIAAIKEHCAAFGLSLNDDTIERLAAYDELVRRENPLLHLVAPCSAAEFATRHVLESLTMLEFLPEGSGLIDIGPGGGLPSVPCLIVRKDLTATLIESKEKKARFLEKAAAELGLKARVRVVARQFSEVKPGIEEFVTCRALDRFADKLPKLLKWSGGRQKLFFGGPDLRAELEKSKLKFTEKLMPLSDQRYLFIIGS